MDEPRKRSRPLVTYLLLASTALVMVYVSILPPSEVEQFYREYAFSTANLLNFSPASPFKNAGVIGLFTYMFLHASWMHLLLNAIALWGAGVIVEREIGSTRYGLVYLLSGVAAALSYSLIHTPSGDSLVGSSGAIFGVIALLFLLMPFKITFALIVPLPSVLVGIMLSAVEFSSFWLSTEPGVAHEAHLAGFVFGCICAFAIDRRRALKGLIIAAAVFVVLYYLGIHFRLI